MDRRAILATAAAPAGNGPVVTSSLFNVRNLPAAPYKPLGGFATNGGNMTKLAERSGLERTHLYRKLKQLDVKLGKRNEE